VAEKLELRTFKEAKLFFFIIFIAENTVFEANDNIDKHNREWARFI